MDRGGPARRRGALHGLGPLGACGRLRLRAAARQPRDPRRADHCRAAGRRVWGATAATLTERGRAAFAVRIARLIQSTAATNAMPAQMPIAFIAKSLILAWRPGAHS